MAEGAKSVRVTIERAPRERVRVPEIRAGHRMGTDQVHAVGAAHEDAPGLMVHHRWIIENLRRRRRKAGERSRSRGGGGSRACACAARSGSGAGAVETRSRSTSTSYDPGVIAITGPNGAGKTTILENMTPWPSMLTRGGPLQQHFRLRDSVRELVIVDDENGRSQNSTGA